MKGHFIASHHVYPQLLHFQVLPIFLRKRPNNSTGVACSTPEIFWVLAEWQVGHFPSRQDSEQDARDERREPELLPRITSHVLRHTACTNMVARGIALDVVKAMSMVSDWCQSRIKRRFQIRRRVKNPYL